MRAKINFLIFNKHNLHILFGFIICITLLLAVFASLHYNLYAFNVFFNSDTLTLPSVYRSLFVDNYPLKGWHFNSSPNFFPDMFFYFIFMKLSGDNFILSSLLYGSIQYLLILWLFKKIFYSLFPEASNVYFLLLTVLQFIFLLELFFFTKDFTYVFYMLSNSFHTSAFLMTLICVLLTFKYILNPTLKSPLIILSLLIIISSLGDKLFIVLYSSVMILTCVFKFKTIGKKPSLVIFILIVLSSAIGWKIYDLIAKSDYVYFCTPFKMFAFDNMISSFHILMEQCGAYMSEFSFKSFSMYISLISFIGLCWLYFKIKKTENKLLSIYITFSIIFCLSAFWVVVINGSYTGWDCMRYNIYAFYIGILNTAVFFSSLTIKPLYKVIGKYIIYGFCFLILGVGIKEFSFDGLNKYLTYYPETVKEIDLLADSNNLKVGISSYWDARKTTLFSKKHLKVYSVFDNLALNDLSSNENWYFNPNVRFDFIILNRLDTNLYKQKITSSKYISNTKFLQAVKTSSFKYDKNEAGYSAINILDSK